MPRLQVRGRSFDRPAGLVVTPGKAQYREGVAVGLRVDVDELHGAGARMAAGVSSRGGPLADVAVVPGDSLVASGRSTLSVGYNLGHTVAK
jgi:hypothetical protein